MLYLLKQLYHTSTEEAEQPRFSRTIDEYMAAVSKDTKIRISGTEK
jgi:hypothetical protein